MENAVAFVLANIIRYLANNLSAIKIKIDEFIGEVILRN